jgi:hypothetical protein
MNAEVQSKMIQPGFEPGSSAECFRTEVFDGKRSWYPYTTESYPCCPVTGSSSDALMEFTGSDAVPWLVGRTKQVWLPLNASSCIESAMLSTQVFDCTNSVTSDTHYESQAYWGKNMNCPSAFSTEIQVFYSMKSLMSDTRPHYQS